MSYCLHCGKPWAAHGTVCDTPLIRSGLPAGTLGSGSLVAPPCLECAALRGRLAAARADADRLRAALLGVANHIYVTGQSCWCNGWEDDPQHFRREQHHAYCLVAAALAAPMPTPSGAPACSDAPAPDLEVRDAILVAICPRCGGYQPRPLAGILKECACEWFTNPPIL